MKPWAYYNEHDPFAAAWLRELIRDNLIAPGEVDERSIEDVTPDELRPFRQCHFFAGVGVWSIAARLAGFRDDEALWSGSCPCQPFSTTGKREGFADERHLWPSFHYLAEQCAPPLIVGEQVAGADGDAWLDLVSADLDATGYAFGAVETCAAGFGAPHKRSRNYWMADRVRAGLEGFAGDGDRGDEPGRLDADPARSAPARGLSRELDDALGDGWRARGDDHGRHVRHELDATGQHGARLVGDPQAERRDGGRGPGAGDGPREVERLGRFREARGMADADAGGRGRVEDGDWREHYRLAAGWHESDGRAQYGGPLRRLERVGRPGPVNGFWRAADWLYCRDDRWRAVKPGSFPLAHARTFRNRVGLVRGAGNAITLGQAWGFLVAVRHATGRG